MASVQNGNKGFDAFELLHQLAWLEVFKRVDDPQDLLSLSKTCISFQNLLEPDKWRWGLSLILPHVAPYLSRKQDQILPNLSQSMTDQDWTGLLNLRLISKRWCKAIDDFLSSPFLQMPERKRLIHNFPTIQSIQVFRERFANWRNNPFPGRAVDFSSQLWILQEAEADHDPNFPNENQQQQLFLRREYIRRNSELVEDFGEHIQSLILRSDSLFGTLRDRYDIIRDLFINLPNLRSLSLPSRYFAQEFSDLEYDQVANYFKENPLPALPHLEEINLTEPRWLKLHYLLIKTYAAQLKRVDSLRPSCETSRALIADMTRLEHFALDLELHYLCNIFENLFQNSPLQTLHVTLTNFGFMTSSKTFYIDKFLQSVRHLPLKTLSIKVSFGVPTITKESGLPLDQFRNDTITFFSFTCKQMIMTTSFNFLEALSKAEVIKLSHETTFDPGEAPENNIPEEEHPSEVPERIRIHPYFYREGFEGDPYTKMYQSNIWELVPSLNTLSVHTSLTHPENPNANQLFQASYSRRVYDRMKLMNLIEIETPPQPLPQPTFFSALKRFLQ